MVTKAIKPTTVYIMEHEKTGMFYMGITTRNLDNYWGSSIPWQKHLEENGREEVIKHVMLVTDDQVLLEKKCKQWSKEFDIVNNNLFFNLVEERGGSIGDQANPNYKDGKWVGRHDDKELERRLYKEADAKKYIKAKASGIAKYRSAAIHAKRNGDKQYAKQNFEKWKLLCVESNKGNALQPSDTFEFWWQCVGPMSWEKREKFYG